MNNTIYVYPNEKDEWILKYPRINIETPAYIGENGVTLKKEEGDRKTLLGEFELGTILGMNSKIKNKNGLEYKQITKAMYWIDDSKSKYYNQLIDVDKVKKDWNSAEHLIEYPIQYEYLIEIKINKNNIPERGSATFLHCTNYKKTVGCIAVDTKVMKELIENIDKQTRIIISTKKNNFRKNY